MLHLDLPTRPELSELIKHRAWPTVSIYLPTTPRTQDARADRIVLKNQLRTAVEQMEAAGAPKRAIAVIEEHVDALVEDDDFWATQANSLAVFAAGELLRTYRLPNKLAAAVEVSDRMHLKPLLRSTTFPRTAFILAISVGGARLLEVSADTVTHPVHVPGMPRDMSAAIGRRSHTERSGPMESGESSSESALLRRYARAVDQAIRPILAGQEKPLIIAASEPLASYAQAVSSYPNTVGKAIAGTPDRTPDHELMAAAHALLDEIYAGQMAEIAELYDRRFKEDRATGDVARAARAATFGAIDTLVYDMDEVLPGTVSDEDGSITFAEAASAASYGIIDEIVSRAFQSGARVMAVRRSDVPGGGSLAAILRYSI